MALYYAIVICIGPVWEPHIETLKLGKLLVSDCASHEIGPISTDENTELDVGCQSMLQVPSWSLVK